MWSLVALLGLAAASDLPCQGVTDRQMSQAGFAVLVDDEHPFDPFYTVCGPGVLGFDRDDYLLAWDSSTGEQVAALRVVLGDPSSKPPWVQVYDPDLNPQVLKALGPVSVRKVKEGESLVSGYQFAKVVGVARDRTVTLDIGFAQGVRAGFQYAVLGEERSGGGWNAESYGRAKLGVLSVVRADATDPNHSVAVAERGLDVQKLKADWTLARFLAKAPPPPLKKGQVRVVLAAFDSAETGAGGQYVDVLHRGLQDLIDAGQLPKNLEVFVSDEAPPAEGYTEQTARALGRKLHATAVLWGSLQCGDRKSCAMPRWTVVESPGGSSGSLTLAPAWQRSGDIGLKLDDPALLPAVAGLALVSLGHFEDAASWLGKALDGLADRKDVDEVSWVLFVYEVEALELLGRWDDGLIEVARWGRTPAGRTPLGQARALIARGTFQEEQGAYGEAERAFTEAQMLSVRQGDQEGVAMAVGNLGIVYKNTGRYAEAEKALLEHRRLAVEMGNQAGVAMAVGNLGGLYMAAGRYAEAERAVLEHRRLAEALGDPARLAAPVGNLGLVYEATGRYAEAEKAFLEAQRLSKALGDQAGVAMAVGNLGLVYEAIGRYAEAEHAFLEVQRLSEALGDQAGVVRAVGNLGLVYEDTGRHTEAEKALLEHRRLAEAMGDLAGVARAVGNLGLVYEANGQYTEAEEAFLEGRHLAEALDNQTGVAAAVGNLGWVYEATGRYSEAEKAFLEAQRLSEALGDPAGVAKAVGSRGLMYMQMGRYADATTQLTDSVRRFATLGIPFEPVLGPLLSLQLAGNHTGAATTALQVAVSQSHSLDTPVIVSIATQAIPWARARHDDEGLLLCLLVLRTVGDASGNMEDLRAAIVDLETRVPKGAIWARLDLPALSKELQQHILAAPLPPANLNDCARTCWELNDAHALRPGVSLQTCYQTQGCGP